MKLFETLKTETEVYTYRRSDGSTFDEKQTFTELELVPKTVNYLLNESGGATLSRIRALITNLYNYRYYPMPDLFGLMRNADDEHAELIVNIIDACSLKYRGSCFKMIDELAPQIIERFNLYEDDDYENNIR